MKNLLKKSFILLTVASMVFLYSCGGEEDPEEPKPAAPTISVTTNSEVVVGDTIQFEIGITALGGFDRFVVREGTTFVGEYDAADFDGVEDGTTTAFTVGIGLLTDAVVGTVLSFNFEVIDKENQTGTDDVDVTIVSPEARSYSAILLSAPTGDFTNKNFFSVSNGLVYSRSDVNATTEPISPLIDFGYYYGNTDNASIASPKGFESSTAFASQVSGWGTKNATVLKTTTLTAAQFLEVTSYADIDLAFDGGTTDDNGIISGLTTGQVLAFQTVAGVKGLIHVKKIEPGFESNDYIELDILAQLTAE